MKQAPWCQQRLCSRIWYRPSRGMTTVHSRTETARHIPAQWPMTRPDHGIEDLKGAWNAAGHGTLRHTENTFLTLFRCTFIPVVLVTYKIYPDAVIVHICISKMQNWPPRGISCTGALFQADRLDARFVPLSDIFRAVIAYPSSFLLSPAVMGIARLNSKCPATTAIFPSHLFPISWISSLFSFSFIFFCYLVLFILTFL